MKKIHNPFIANDDHHCFGCSPKNSFGLQMDFYEEGEFVMSKWAPQKAFTGFDGVLHGGVQSTIIDEIASWVVFVKLETGGMTANLNVTYLKSLKIQEELLIKACVQEKTEKYALVSVELINASGEVCTKGTANYRIFSPALAKKKLKYPGIEKFYKE